jgi:hypothetical protein
MTSLHRHMPIAAPRYRIHAKATAPYRVSLDQICASNGDSPLSGAMTVQRCVARVIAT